MTCDSYVDDAGGGTLCSTGLLPTPDGNGILCPDGGCDDATCCEGGKRSGLPSLQLRFGSPGSLSRLGGHVALLCEEIMYEKLRAPKIRCRRCS